MSHEFINSAIEGKELSLSERDAYSFLLATLTGRIAAKEHSFDRDPQKAIERWAAENGQRFDEAFDEMKEEHPDWISHTDYSNQELAIEYIEAKLRP